MLKTIGKAVFIAFGVIFAFIVYNMSYNSGAYNNYSDLVSNSKTSLELTKAFSMYNLPVDSEPVFESEGDDNKISIYRTINTFNIAYFEAEDSEDAKSYAKAEFMYLMFIKNPTTDYLRNSSNVGGVIKNETGLRFNGVADSSKEFKFVVDAQGANKDLYIEKPLSEIDALFGCSRNISTAYQSYGFIYIQMPETFINEMASRVGGPITSLELIDRDGNVFGNTINVNLDFSGKFYQDMADFKKNYDIYANKGNQAEGYDDAYNYLEGFNAEALGYTSGYSKDMIYPGSLIASSIGIVALFLLAVFIVYMLIFHFALIKRLVFRENKTRYVPNKNRRPNYAPNNNAKKNDSIDAKVTEIKDVNNEENK